MNCSGSGCAVPWLAAPNRDSAESFGPSTRTIVRVSGFLAWSRRAAAPAPVDFTWSLAAEDSRAHEQLFAFLASGSVSCNKNISGWRLHWQRQMIDAKKCIFCLIM
jgi:hypothetical protein